MSNRVLCRNRQPVTWSWLGLLLALLSREAFPATFEVISLADRGDGSLRQAIERANESPGDDRIEFAVRGSIRLESPLPALAGNTTIRGPGRDLLEVSGEQKGRVFATAEGTTNTFAHLTISNGQLPPNEHGAGVHNAGDLVLSNCVVTANRTLGGWGGGLFSRGNLTLIACDVSGNSAMGGPGREGSKTPVPDAPGTGTGGGGGGGGLGGGIYSQAGHLQVLDSRFFTNVAVGGAGGGSAAVAAPVGSGGAPNGGAGGAPGSPGTDGGLGGGGGGGSVPSGGVLGGADAGGSEFGGGVGGDGFRNPILANPGSGGGGGGLGVQSGAVSVVNSTFIGNRARGGPMTTSALRLGGVAFGGGVCVTTGRVELIHCTLTANEAIPGVLYGDPILGPPFFEAPSSGGGFANESGTLTLRNTLIADNAATRLLTPSDGSGPVLSEGVNLIWEAQGIVGLSAADRVGVLPRIENLRMNGGPTPTQALLANSPAIDAATADPALSTDQRGDARIVGPRPDIGAYEADFAPAGALAVLLDGDRVAGETATVDTADVEVSFVSSYPNATVVYTLDGSLPTPESVAYSGPFRIADDRTLRALCFRRDFGDSTSVGPVQIRFATERRHRLSMNVVGNGSVGIDPPEVAYVPGRTVRLYARPAFAWKLARWTGHGTGANNVLELSMDGDKAVGAEFEPDLTAQGPLFRLSVRSVGPGKVELAPAGGLYPSNTMVRLRPIPALVPGGLPLAYLRGWSGDINPTPWHEPMVVMDRHRNVVAEFIASSPGGFTYYQFRTEVLGKGRVLETSPFVHANGYYSDTTAEIRAIPDLGWDFRHWADKATGTLPTSAVTMSGEATAVAVFGTRLSTTVSGAGTITMDPADGETVGFDPVRLTAIPAAGSYFVRWGDLGFGDRSPLDVVVREATPTVSALFAPLRPGESALTLGAQGRGRVESVPAGNRHPTGMTLTLQALPKAGQRFLRWSGDASGTANPLELRMDASKSVTAIFTDAPILALSEPFGFQTPTRLRLRIEGPQGRTYQVQRSADLTTWSHFGTVKSLSRTADTWVALPRRVPGVGFSGGPQAYYRVVAVE
jgi:hypothetical protein